MRNLMFVSALFGLAACGPTEESFSEDFVTAYCDAWTACNTTTDCPVSSGGTTTTTGTSTCDFDKAAASDCLDGEFTCNTDVPGFEYVEAPAACANVCGSGGTTGTTTSTSSTGTTTAS